MSKYRHCPVLTSVSSFRYLCCVFCHCSHMSYCRYIEMQRKRVQALLSPKTFKIYDS